MGVLVIKEHWGRSLLEHLCLALTLYDSSKFAASLTVRVATKTTLLFAPSHLRPSVRNFVFQFQFNLPDFTPSSFSFSSVYQISQPAFAIPSSQTSSDSLHIQLRLTFTFLCPFPYILTPYVDRPANEPLALSPSSTAYLSTPRCCQFTPILHLPSD
jgi:hypothetical protein